MLPRFFAPGAIAGAPEIELPDEEARHATRVMRLRPGDDIAVFDGAGGEWRARITKTGKNVVRAAILDRIDSAREPRVPLTLAQAVLKGDHMDAVIRDATMLGVVGILPLLTARTVPRVDAAAGAKARDRWARVALASAKQCRRATLPAIVPPMSVEKLLQAPEAPLRLVLAEPSANVRSIAAGGLAAPASATLAAGPEGGWSAPEMDVLLNAGFRPVTLGGLTLRADVTALVAISMLRAAWNDV